VGAEEREREELAWVKTVERRTDTRMWEEGGGRKEKEGPRRKSEKYERVPFLYRGSSKGDE